MLILNIKNKVNNKFNIYKMGNRKSKAKNKPISSSKEKNEFNEAPVISSNKKLYLDDPVFGRMVYNEIVGAWVPAYNEDLYEQSHRNYLNEKEKNEKYLKTFNIQPEKIKNFYEDVHTSLSIIKNIPIKKDVYSYAYFLKDGRLAINWDNQLKIYSKDFTKIEQTIQNESTFIAELKDNSLINCRYNGVDIYQYVEKINRFIFNYSLECINMAEKVIELPNDRLALLSDFISIYVKENGKYIKNGKDLRITTIDDLILINESEIASISGQESVITFWDLNTREINAQIGDIENFGHTCLLLFDKSLIVGGANKNFSSDSIKFIYVINIDNKELIKKYSFSQNIWFMTQLNEKEFVTGESEGIITKYRFEENELKLMETNRDHGNSTVQILAFCSNNNQLASMSDNKIIIFQMNEVQN